MTLKAVVCAMVAGFLYMLAMMNTSQARDWTQLYFSAGGGADAITGDVATPFGGALSARNIPLGGDLGLRAGIGVDYQISPGLVGGVYADFDRSNTSTGAFVNSPTTSGSITVLSVGQNYSVGGRLGVLIQPQTLVYGLIGYNWLKLGSEIPAVANGLPIEFHSPLFHGGTLGAGLEHRLTDNLSLRGEYRFSQFQEENVISNLGTDALSLQPRLHSGRVSIAYRFGNTSGPGKTTLAPSARRPNWTGFYLGGHLGAEALTRDLIVNLPTIPARAGLTGIGGGGLDGGLDAGYDYMLNNTWLAGAFIGADWSNDLSDITVSAGGSSGRFSLLGLGYTLTLGGRIGYVASQDTLIYGLGGYTEAHLNDPKFTLTSGGVSDTTTLINLPIFSGFTVGGGFEERLVDNLSLRAEYRYTKLGSQTIFSQPGILSVDLDPAIHSGRLELTYRFGSGSP